MAEILTLKGKKALVTGATKGIGRRIAYKLASAGVHLVVAGRSEERARETVHELEQFPVKTRYFLGDISDERMCESLVHDAANFLDGMDILVNCAGVLTATPIEHITRVEWDHMLAVNLTGTFFMIQQSIPYLKKSNAGRIINISSNAGRMGGFENSQAYTASKGGMIAITKGIARQLAPFGITVNVVCPGTTETEMVKEYSEEKIKRLKQRIPLGRLGKPEETAATVCFLASEEAGFITGAALDVNGGLYMG